MPDQADEPKVRPKQPKPPAGAHNVGLLMWNGLSRDRFAW
jgi:hypothetical protein